MGYLIRDGCEGDFDVVCTFLDLYLRRDYFIPHQQLRQALRLRYHEIHLAIDGNRVLGLAIVTRGKRTLVNLLVSPCERKRGIGDALLCRARVERIRAKLDVSDGDPRSYYQRRGYRGTGEFNKKGNIEIMVLDVDAPPSWL